MGRSLVPFLFWSIVAALVIAYGCAAATFAQLPWTSPAWTPAVGGASPTVDGSGITVCTSGCNSEGITFNIAGSSKTGDRIYMCALSNTANTVGVSDTASLTWTSRTSVSVAGSTPAFYLTSYYSSQAAGAITSDTVTVTTTGASYVTAGIVAVNGSSGFDTNVSLPGTGQSNSLNAAPINISTTAAFALAIGCFRFSATATPTQGTGWTLQANGANGYYVMETKALSVATTNLSVTSSNDADTNAVIGDAYKQ